jgi:ParB family chromosome partitioning protein
MKLNEMLKKAENKLHVKSDSSDEIPEENNSAQETIEAPWQTTSITTKSVNDPTNNSIEYLTQIPTSDIQNWEFHDRPESELGDLQSLADEFIKIGQKQPCLIRPTQKGSKQKYELIIGERRWRAAKLAGIKLKVIIDDNLTDTDAALAQAAENDNRVNLSDYAKGISFSKLIQDNIIQQKDLIEKLGKSKQYISALLSFSKIHPDLILAVKDWSNVSARVAEKIKQLCNKGEEHLKALINISDKIKTGKIGEKAIERLISEQLTSAATPYDNNKKILSRDGRHIFTWRTDNNLLPSIHFPKQINDLFQDNKISMDEFTENMKSSLEGMLKKL